MINIAANSPLYYIIAGGSGFRKDHTNRFMRRAVQPPAYYFFAAMNSPQNEVATEQEQLNELLNVLLEGFCPAENAGESDRELTSPELQINLLAHSGIEFTLQQINDSMKQRAYKLKASTAMELEWMLKRL
jgi:hypothetical protein